MKRWYVVHTHTGKEAMAEGHLLRQSFDAYLPRRIKLRRHARKTANVTVPFFPRYIFVGLDLDAQRWHAINSTFGVRGLVSFGERPSPLPEGVIDEIRARENAEGVIDIAEAPPFKYGEVVEITHGSFAEQAGLFHEMDDQKRIVVLMSMLGRDVKVPLPLHAVRRIA